MRKTFFTISSIILIIATAILWYLGSNIKINWGHHFTFENELGIEIDSLSITVGDKSTMVLADSDGSNSLQSNIEVPDSGYPHLVELIIYSGEHEVKLTAEPFDCYNCDGSHQYTLTYNGAIYQFLN